MYYEFYIDVFFVENLIMDYLLLWMTGHFLKCRILHERILLGSLIGALGACIPMLVPVPARQFAMILGYGLGSILMLKMALHIESRQTFQRALLIFYAVTFLSGGLLEMLTAFMSLPILAAAVAGVGILVLIQKAYVCVKGKAQYFYHVTLEHHGKSVELKALMDTGNFLREPFFGRPVSIVDEDILKELIGEGEIMMPIPYHSIGRTHGILEGLTLDGMSIQKENESQKIVRPVVAIAPKRISMRGEYRMILSPFVIEA